ncbi:MAG: hypothetical protein LUD72_01130 [Bacteroidales bacterium]|nr:hypothetical protein [Bacteroidales bacterium]
MATQTLKEEMTAMKTGATKVYPLRRRATVCSTATYIKRWTGQVYHVTTDWEGGVLIVRREA